MAAYCSHYSLFIECIFIMTKICTFSNFFCTKQLNLTVKCSCRFFDMYMYGYNSNYFSTFFRSMVLADDLSTLLVHLSVHLSLNLCGHLCYVFFFYPF